MSEVEQAVVDELVGNAHGNLARVQELLNAHPTALNRRATWNESAVEAATQMGNKPILELLIARGAPVDFFTACVLGHVEDVAAELATNPERAGTRGVHELPALYFAAIGGSRAIAERLLAAGADVNARAEAAGPIHGAVMGGDPEMVRLLLERGADPTLPDYQGRNPRRLAEDIGRQDLASLFEKSRRPPPPLPH
ncbi:MAG: ankyrin repeat domain-containing protein [Candidatus Dormibacteraeota bacterium]|nr:ankyrin repeat domain-containing protein [Candidatus Dormibacteraeota bacterium]